MLEITTGTRIPVSRDGEEVGSFIVRPDDVVFNERVYELMGELDRADREYSRRAGELDADKTEGNYGLPANHPQKLALLREVCEAMRKQIDEIFGDGTAQLCFGDALDLGAIWDFFEGVTPYLDEAHQERVKKYTQQRGNRQQRRALKK